MADLSDYINIIKNEIKALIALVDWEHIVEVVVGWIKELFKWNLTPEQEDEITNDLDEILDAIDNGDTETVTEKITIYVSEFIAKEHVIPDYEHHTYKTGPSYQSARIYYHNKDHKDIFYMNNWHWALYLDKSKWNCDGYEWYKLSDPSILDPYEILIQSEGGFFSTFPRRVMKCKFQTTDELIDTAFTLRTTWYGFRSDRYNDPENIMDILCSSGFKKAIMAYDTGNGGPFGIAISSDLKGYAYFDNTNISHSNGGTYPIFKNGDRIFYAQTRNVSSYTVLDIYRTDFDNSSMQFPNNTTLYGTYADHPDTVLTEISHICHTNNIGYFYWGGHASTILDTYLQNYIARDIFVCNSVGSISNISVKYGQDRQYAITSGLQGLKQSHQFSSLSTFTDDTTNMNIVPLANRSINDLNYSAPYLYFMHNGMLYEANDAIFRYSKHYTNDTDWDNDRSAFNNELLTGGKEGWYTYAEVEDADHQGFRIYLYLHLPMYIYYNENGPLGIFDYTSELKRLNVLRRDGDEPYMTCYTCDNKMYAIYCSQDLGETCILSLGFDGKTMNLLNRYPLNSKVSVNRIFNGTSGEIDNFNVLFDGILPKGRTDNGEGLDSWYDEHGEHPDEVPLRYLTPIKSCALNQMSRTSVKGIYYYQMKTNAHSYWQIRSNGYRAGQYYNGYCTNGPVIRTTLPFQFSGADYWHNTDTYIHHYIEQNLEE